MYEKWEATQKKARIHKNERYSIKQNKTKQKPH